MTTTNIHLHLFSADHTPPQQLYYLLRGALHSVARDMLQDILHRPITTQDLKNLDLSLDRYQFPWPQAVPLVIGDNLVDPKKLINMFTTISRIDRNDARQALGVNQNESPSDMTRALVNRINAKAAGNDPFPFRSALCDLVADLFAGHEKGVKLAGGKRVSHAEVWTRYLQTPGASEFDRCIVLSVNFDQAFGREPLPNLSAKPSIRFKDQLAELRELAATDQKVVPFFCIEPRGYNPGGLLSYVKDNVGKGKPFKGLKVYPPMGIMPDSFDPAVFEYCQDLGIPVITHCSVGGAGVRGSTVNFADYAKPNTWRQILDRLRNRWKASPTSTRFKLCFAHWDGLDGDPQFSWAQELIQLMTEFNGSEGVELYADVAFNTVGSVSAIQNYKNNLEKIKRAGVDSRVLYGTDWWMYLYSEIDEASFKKQLHVDDPQDQWWSSSSMEQAANAFLKDVL